MLHRRRVVAVVTVVLTAVGFLGLGASPASAASQEVVLNVQINGAAPAGLRLEVQLNCSPRGVPPDYVFNGAATRTIDVTGSGNCGVNVFDTSGQSTSVGVKCAASAPTVTCSGDSSANWDLSGTVAGTATFTVAADFPAATTTTTAESTTTTSSTTTTTQATTTTSGTQPTSTTSLIATTTTTVAADRSGSSNNLVWFILAGLAFLAVLGTLLWYLFGRKDDTGKPPGNGNGNGNGGSGPGSPSGPVPGAPGSMTPVGPPTTATAYAPPADPNAPAWGPPPDTAPPSTPTPPSGYRSPPGSDEPPPTVANPGLS